MWIEFQHKLSKKERRESIHILLEDKIKDICRIRDIRRFNYIGYNIKIPDFRTDFCLLDSGDIKQISYISDDLVTI